MLKFGALRSATSCSGIFSCDGGETMLRTAGDE